MRWQRQTLVRKKMPCVSRQRKIRHELLKGETMTTNNKLIFVILSIVILGSFALFLTNRPDEITAKDLSQNIEICNARGLEYTYITQDNRLRCDNQEGTKGEFYKIKQGELINLYTLDEHYEVKNKTMYWTDAQGKLTLWKIIC